jgi:hypothetical protein
MSLVLALFGHAAMSDLSPVCAQKRTSASRAAMLKTPNSLKEILSRVGVPGGLSIKVGGLVKVSQAAALNRSKRKASRSRSGRSLVRLGKCMVPPSSRFRDSSIGPSFCPSSRSETWSR